MLRLSGELYAAIQKMQTAQRELTQRFQRPPTRQEIADYTGLTVPQIEEAQRAAVRPLSLDAPVGSNEDRTEFGENLADPASERVSDTSARHELQDSLVKMLDDLSEREKTVIQMRFGIGDYADHGSQSTEDVAAQLRISRERVQELEKRGIRKMRKKARGSGLERLLGPGEDDEEDEDQALIDML
jgi:RNA polymerase primary sigma factor